MVGAGPFFFGFCHHLGERIPQGFAAVRDCSLGAVSSSRRANPAGICRYAIVAGEHVLGRCYLPECDYEGAIFQRCALSIAA